jgi:uncharacterized protein YndB with AHSA1/START domain
MRRTSVAVAGLAAGYAALQVLGRRAGSTAAERASVMPGDDLVPCPQMRTDHAATIDAPPERVWPWLTQLGWHLGGWYTPHWVDQLLFPDNWESLDRLDPALLRDLQVGDTIPDGKPGTAEYVVVEVDDPHLLVLRSTTHIPPGWDEKFDVRFVWTWAIRLTELDGGRTRVHLRVRGRGSPWWFNALYVAGIIPADFVMATGMLRGLTRRVEAAAEPAGSGPEPLTRARTPSAASEPGLRGATREQVGRRPG